jgi:2-oxoglutarate dehydrogenase E2 component (dihydrolipoamide succinyltransferase)
MHQHDIDISAVQPNASGRVQQSDVAAQVDVSSPKPSDVGPLKQSKPSQDSPFADRQEREVPMTRLRQTIAQRLLDSQRLTASLTTFNELDMTKVMDLRKRYQAEFTEKYGVKLGFMSFFTKACCRALQAFPEVNASVRESNIVYHDYCDIGIAVSTEKGLVVPIIRDADQLEMDEIEQQILDYSGRAKSNKLTLDDLSGGTFSITNGGVFGSMLSTPILNPPQSAILGMHNIVKRPVVVDNAIQIRPMMYLALTYDHRMIDGSQAVQFLVMVKDLLEDPDRLLLQV